MVVQQDLKKLEKSLYSKFQEDGLWDILLGLFFLLLGLLTKFSDTTYIGFIAGGGTSLVYVMKRKITQPRLGYVRFSKMGKIKERTTSLSVALVLVLIGTLGVILFYKFSPGSNPPSIIITTPKVLFMLVLSLVLVAVAIVLNIKRFIWYGIMIATLFSLGGLAQLKESYMLIISGSLMFVNGVKLLSEFIKKYPKLDSTIENSGA